MRNYAGNRFSPWLGHLMVSRQETARPLLTPGEIMQLPPDDEIVMISGTYPIRAKKARYFEDTLLCQAPSVKGWLRSMKFPLGTGSIARRYGLRIETRNSWTWCASWNYPEDQLIAIR